MVSPPPGNHSFRVLVGDPNFPSLINCGHNLHKKRLYLKLEAYCMALNMKKTMPLHLMPRREKVREESFMEEKEKLKYQVPIQNKRRIRIFLIFSDLDVRSMVTMPKSIADQKRENTKPQLLISMHILHTRNSRNDNFEESTKDRQKEFFF